MCLAAGALSQLAVQTLPGLPAPKIAAKARLSNMRDQGSADFHEIQLLVSVKWETVLLGWLKKIDSFLKCKSVIFGQKQNESSNLAPERCGG